MHVPSASIVTFDPLTEQIDVVVLENVTDKPEDELADTANGVAL